MSGLNHRAPASAGPLAHPDRRLVCMLCPGGFEHAGGIGRWAGYLFAAWPALPNAPKLVIIDTRGHGGMIVAASTFLLALVHVVWLRLTFRLGLLHINLSVRGSTVRKCMLSIIAHWAGVPTVVHLHSGRFGEFYNGLPRWAQATVRRMFQRATCIIVPGRIWQEMLARELGVERERVLVMPNAVAKPTHVARQVLRGGPCHIVMLGRMGPPKGLPELMEALGSASMSELDWCITIAGDGDGDACRKDAHARGIGDKVTIPGWLGSNEVASLLASADILVLPSRSENLPISVIEALSYGVAVVTTPVGAIPEIVEDGVSALLVPVRDPDALATALHRLITDPVLRRRISEGGYEVFLNRLDIDRYAETLSAIYNRLLDGDRVAHQPA